MDINMKFNMEKLAPLNALLAAGIGVFLFYLGVNVSAFFALFLYFPFTTLFLSEKPGWTILAILLAGVGIGFLTSWESAIWAMPQLVVIPLLTGWFLKRDQNAFLGIVVPALWFALISLGVLLVEQQLTGVNTLDVIRQSVMGLMDEMLEILKSQGANTAQLTQYEYVFSKGVDVTLQHLPAIMFMYGGLVVTVTTILSRAVASRTTGTIRPVDASRFVFPRQLTLALLAAGVLGIFVGSWIPILGTIVSNLWVASGFLYFLNGLARLDVWLDQRGVHPVARVLLYVFVLSFFFIAMILAVAGFARSLRKTGQQGPDAGQSQRGPNDPSAGQSQRGPNGPGMGQSHTDPYDQRRAGGDPFDEEENADQSSGSDAEGGPHA